jgi:aminoglycoside/choline kinase family phosphotransferase
MSNQSGDVKAQMRDDDIAAFLAKSGWAKGRVEKLVDDASARRYFRISKGYQTALLMDFPPSAVSFDPHGVYDNPERPASVEPVIATTEMFLRCGWRVPQILASDATAGLLLIEDFGDLTFTKALEMGEIAAPSLYIHATDALIDLHRIDPGHWTDRGLVVYGPENLKRQLAAFGVDYLPWIVGDDGARDRALAEFDQLLETVLPACWQVGETLIHRDYHVDNLMLVETDDGDADCGIIDFQDAAIGPRPYDLVSLLRDVRHDVGVDLENAMIDRYLAAFPDIDRDRFVSAYIATGMVRNFRILGRFGKLARQPDKRRYLEFIPRTWELILRGASDHLPALADWVDAHVPPKARFAPDIPVKTQEGENDR